MSFLVILGMHRSGTSLMAAMLRELGWDVGPEDDLMPAKPDNPRGFVEHMPLVNLNGRLLYQFGGTWSEPPAFPTGWEDHPRIDHLRDEGRDIIAALAGAGPPGVLVKDPRLSLTLPFWRPLLPADTHVVDVTRPPAAVVRSLLRREDDLDAEAMAALYVEYVLSASAVAPEATVVDTRRLHADPVATLTAVTRGLGVDATPDAITAAAGVLDPALWGRTPDKETVEAEPSPSLELATRVHDLVTGEDGRAWRRLLGDLAPRDAIARISHARDAAVGEEVLATLTARERADRHRSERDEWRRKHEQVRNARDAAQQQVLRLRQELDAAQARSAALVDEKRDDDRLVRRLRDERDRLHDEHEAAIARLRASDESRL